MSISDADLFAKLRGVIQRGWIDIPDHHGYRGTGSPGLILEELIGVNTNICTRLLGVMAGQTEEGGLVLGTQFGVAHLADFASSQVMRKDRCVHPFPAANSVPKAY